jgi:hypothetical protein
MNEEQKRKILSLYVPKHLVKEGLRYSTLLYPFWGVWQKAESHIQTAMFNQYNFDPDYYSVVDDPDTADYVFMPHNYWTLLKKHPEIIKEHIKEAKKYNKPLLIDAIGDKVDVINIPNSVTLRYSQYRNRLKDSDVVVPVFTEDLLASYENEKLTIRDKKERPSIGFAGWASLPFFKYPKTHIKDLPLFLLGFITRKFNLYRKGVFLRSIALKALESSRNIDTNFIYRKSFSGNVATAQKDIPTLRKEFVDNILNSDYVLCVKGDANQSTRFFETLSLGRIPLFVDTDIVLPLEGIIDYKDFCVFTNYRSMKKLPQILTDFHKNISPEKFRDMQKNAREAYDKYIRMDVYTKYLMDELKEKIES